MGKLTQNKELEVEREIWGLPYRLALKMYKELKSEENFKKDSKIEKINAELESSLYQKIRFFLRLAKDKEGNFSDEIHNEINGCKKDGGIVELLGNSLHLYFEIWPFQKMDEDSIELYVDRQICKTKSYRKILKELKKYEESKSIQGNKLLKKPHELKRDELRILALKTILEEPSDNNEKFEGKENEEDFFRTDLYFLLHEKGFKYCNKIFVKINLTDDANGLLIQELENASKEVEKLKAT